MRKIAAFLYHRSKPPITVNSLFSLCYKLALDIEFVIEAGSHHGVDTLKFAGNKKIKKIFCFEPNPASRAIFMQNLENVSTDRFMLFDFGLSNREYEALLFLATIDLGSEKFESAGTSSLSKTWAHSNGSAYTVFLKKLDSVFVNDHYSLIDSDRKGLLWLDVEGHALEALEGMKKTLKCIAIAKIEIEYSKQRGQWETKSIFRIVYFMARAGFIPYSGYLHPVARGDMCFVHIRKSNFLTLKKALTYFSLAMVFYGVIYPVKDLLTNIKSNKFPYM